jgi:FMN phosphatase YigB (HAD superfamily)
MQMPSTLEAVVFDVDGTLYHQSPLRRKMAIRLMAAHVLKPLRARRVLGALSAYRHAQEDLRTASGADLANQQLSVAAERSGLPVADVRAIVEQWMEVAPLPLLSGVARSGMRPALERLRAAGLRLAVLSDYPAERKLEAMGIADLFDVVLCAQDPSIGIFKPNPRGIEVALERLQVDASRAVYVGDRPEVDAAAAEAAGVACIIVGAAATSGGGAPTYRALPDFASIAATLVGN